MSGESRRSLRELRHSRHAWLLRVAIASWRWWLAELGILRLRISLTVRVLRVLRVAWWSSVTTEVACLRVAIVLRWSTAVRTRRLAWVLAGTLVHKALVGLECTGHCVEEIVLGFFVSVLSVPGFSDDLRTVDFSGHAGVLDSIFYSASLCEKNFVVALNIKDPWSSILQSTKFYKEEVDSHQYVVASPAANLGVL